MPRLGILVAALACLAATGAALVVDMPNVAGALRDLTHSLGPWTYAIVAALVLLETVAVLGLLSPGEAVLAVGGAAASHGAVELPVIIAAAWAAAVVGDATGFGLGRRHGRALLVRAGPRIGICARRLARLERLILRWGGVALVAGRFVGLVRSSTPFLAGASGMPLRRLVGFSIAGAAHGARRSSSRGTCLRPRSRAISTPPATSQSRSPAASCWRGRCATVRAAGSSPSTALILARAARFSDMGLCVRSAPARDTI